MVRLPLGFLSGSKVKEGGILNAGLCELSHSAALRETLIFL